MEYFDTRSDKIKNRMIAAGFTIGPPKVAGWYLVAARSNDKEERYFVHQVWFNPDSIYGFYAGAGLTQKEPYYLRDKVKAFAHVPDFNQ